MGLERRLSPADPKGEARQRETAVRSGAEGSIDHMEVLGPRGVRGRYADREVSWDDIDYQDR